MASLCTKSIELDNQLNHENHRDDNDTCTENIDMTDELDSQPDWAVMASFEQSIQLALLLKLLTNCGAECINMHASPSIRRSSEGSFTGFYDKRDEQYGQVNDKDRIYPPKDCIGLAFSVRGNRNLDG
jgi:hypothetical protein